MKTKIKDSVILPIRISEEMYEKIREVSFRKHVSLAEVCRQSLVRFLESSNEKNNNTPLD